MCFGAGQQDSSGYSLAKEGWLRPLRKCREATIRAQTVWFVQEKLFWSLNEPPRPRLSKERGYFLMARPPLLCQGGEFASSQLRQQSNAYNFTALCSRNQNLSSELRE